VPNVLEADFVEPDLVASSDPTPPAPVDWWVELVRQEFVSESMTLGCSLTSGNGKEGNQASTPPPTTPVADDSESESPPPETPPTAKTSFADSLRLPIATPLLSAPRVRVSKVPKAWIPRRSDRLAAKSIFRDPQPEKQARRVLLNKWRQ